MPLPQILCVRSLVSPTRCNGSLKPVAVVSGNTAVFLPLVLHQGTHTLFSFQGTDESVPQWYAFDKILYHSGMDKTRKAKTIRLDEQDWEAIAAIKEHYGISSDTDTIRFALRALLRQLKQQGLGQQTPHHWG